jgi:hypothetical protein
MIEKICIYGERCSGTNYLEELLTNNFSVKQINDYGHKHFFGFNDLSNSDETLFIGIIRNPYDWLNSLYRDQHHLPPNFKDINYFLNTEFYSLNNNNNEIMTDRNIYTKERYKNIFDMRYTKIKFLTEDMPKLVKNYILIKYEDLINNFNITINKIRSKGLKIKRGIYRPLNIQYYKKEKDKHFVKNQKVNHISKEEIIDKLNMYYEKTVLNYDI